MDVDINEFFREATLRICGHLDIEKGLQSCLTYISQYLPADRIYLEKHEQGLGAMRIIVRADARNGDKMDLLIPYSKEAKAAMAQFGTKWGSGKLPPVLAFNEPEDDPVTKCILVALGEPMSSTLSLPLIIEDKMVGALALIAEGNNRYNEDHIKLFATLKEPFFVAMSNTLKHQEVVKLKDLLQDDNRYLQKELQNKVGDNLIGANFGLKSVLEMVQKVAKLDSPVLLMGETGTGKDLIANAIHYSSSRSDGPFISVNCGAIPESLIDSELFGHEKGAFTGALKEKRGRFERAHGGTIFLDEIGELPLQAQVRLLRVLQNREIERVGGTKTIKLNIRIITATNRNLEAMVKNKTFREDLWFRLNVFPIHIPSLRDRISDIPALVQYFIEKKSGELKLPYIPELEPGSIDMLMDYSWPGNVRELENIIERALILCKEKIISFKHMLKTESNINNNSVPSADNELLVTLDEAMARYIKKVLSKTGGKIHGPGGAAELLGINANTLRNRMKKLGINFN